jgi:hypothetical protein
MSKLKISDSLPEMAAFNTRSKLSYPDNDVSSSAWSEEMERAGDR